VRALADQANLLPYLMNLILWILMLMESDELKQAPKPGVEYLKGCPVCDHTNPQLEREVHAFAQLLFDIWLARQNGNENSKLGCGIDKEL
jgi:hypothetical protein